MEPAAVISIDLELATLETLERPALMGLIVEQRRQLEEMRATIERQAARIEELERQVNRNSRNSHKPPSSDGPGTFRRGQLPARGGRRGASGVGKRAMKVTTGAYCQVRKSMNSLRCVRRTVSTVERAWWEAIRRRSGNRRWKSRRSGRT